MWRALAAAPPLLLLASCAEDLGIDTTLYACASDVDCARGTLCHPFEHICRAEGYDAGIHPDAAAPDAGPRPDAEPAPDAAEPEDAGPPPDGSIPHAVSEAIGWCWVHGQSASDLGRLIREKNGRIIDLEIEESAPMRYTAVLVENTGSQAKRWWWVPDGGGADVAESINGNGARLVDLEPYVDARHNLRFAAVLIANAGSDASGWWWYYSQTRESLASHLATNRARLIDVDAYTDGSTRRLSGLMVPNSDSRVWSWDEARTRAEITSTAAASRASVIVLEPSLTSSATFAYVVERRPRFTSTTIFDATAEAIDRATLGEGKRILQISTLDTPAGRRWSAVLIENIGGVTLRVRELIRPLSPDPFGLSLEEAGGAARAGFGLTARFDPGASLHALLLLHALRSGASLEQVVPIYGDPPPGECPAGPSTGTETLRDALRAAMAGDANRARAVSYALGLPAIAATASAIGMADTPLGGPPGCAAAAIASTTSDLDALARGLAASTSSAAIFALMSERDGLETGARAIASSEGRTARLGAEALAAFQAGVSVHAMTGAGNALGVLDVARCAGGRTTKRSFTFALHAPAAAYERVKLELFREPIRESAAGFAACFP